LSPNVAKKKENGTIKVLVRMNMYIEKIKNKWHIHKTGDKRVMKDIYDIMKTIYHKT